VSATESFEDFFAEISRGGWASPADPGHRVGDALRRLAARALAGPPTEAELAALAVRLEGIEGEAAPGGTRYRDEDRPLPGRPRGVRPNGNGTHPLAGPRNAMAPPIVLSLGEDPVHGRVAYGHVVYDVRFEGLPGLAQGGFLAAGFDLMLGQGVAMAGHRGVTGTLSVRYLVPTPLYEPLRYEAWCARREGRKGFAQARLVRLDSGAVCAEAEGVFITPKGGPS
jgi:acyl-coenzyme A thioesterase PaaI-like protein